MSILISVEEREGGLLTAPDPVAGCRSQGREGVRDPLKNRSATVPRVWRSCASPEFGPGQLESSHALWGKPWRNGGERCHGNGFPRDASQNTGCPILKSVGTSTGRQVTQWKLLWAVKITVWLRHRKGPWQLSGCNIDWAIHNKRQCQFVEHKLRVLLSPPVAKQSESLRRCFADAPINLEALWRGMWLPAGDQERYSLPST